MIFYYKITIQELSKNGKNHKWGRHFCLACSRFMWGHGYVQRYFSELANGVFVKRYRCPDCNAVVTVRPVDYWQGFRSSIKTMYGALKSKLSGLWPADCPRQRGGHWLRRFSRYAQMEVQISLTSFLDACFIKQIRFLPDGN